MTVQWTVRAANDRSRAVRGKSRIPFSDAKRKSVHDSGRIFCLYYSIFIIHFCENGFSNE